VNVQVLILSLVCAGWAHDTMASCPSGQDTKFICGTVNSEDLIQLPGSHWVISSGMNGPKAPAGHLFLINTLDKTVKPLYPLAQNRYRQDHELFSSCPGKPKEDEFVAHGINVRRIGKEKYTLYVINHGARESVEVFEVDAIAKEAEITWVGCVITPHAPKSDGALLGNAITPLADNGFALTVNPVDDMESTDRLISGKVTGLVMAWSPRFGWRQIPGGELSFDNGIEASPDGKWLFVNATFAPGMYRLSIGRTPFERVLVKTSFYPDNIRWGDDGFLYLTGTVGDVRDELRCLGSEPSCPFPFKVVRIDPQTLKTTELINDPGGPLFGLATGVAKVGNEIWVSTGRGTRIATFPLREPILSGSH